MFLSWCSDPASHSHLFSLLHVGKKGHSWIVCLPIPPSLTALPLLSPLAHVDSLCSESAPVQPWMVDHVALPRISVPVASHSWDHHPYVSTTLPHPTGSDWSAVYLHVPQTSGPSAALRPRLLSASHESLVTLPSPQSSGTLALPRLLIAAAPPYPLGSSMLPGSSYP